MMFGLELSMHPFTLSPSYQKIAHLPLAQRLKVMRDPELRAQIIIEEPASPHVPMLGGIRKFDGMFELNASPNYEPKPEDSITSRAHRDGIKRERLAYDLLVSNPGQALLYLPFANYADSNLDAASVMLRHTDFVPGLCDGGAHCGVICDASYSTFMLTHLDTGSIAWRTPDRSRRNQIFV